MKIVPREPTPEMYEAGEEHYRTAPGTESRKIGGCADPDVIWRSMWDAAPPASVQGEPVAWMLVRADGEQMWTANKVTADGWARMVKSMDGWMLTPLTPAREAVTDALQDQRPAVETTSPTIPGDTSDSGGVGAPQTANVRGTKVTVQGWYRHHTVELGYDAYDQVVAFLFTLKPQTSSGDSGSAADRDDSQKRDAPSDVYCIKISRCRMANSSPSRLEIACIRAGWCAAVEHLAAARESAGSSKPTNGDLRAMEEAAALLLRERKDRDYHAEMARTHMQFTQDYKDRLTQAEARADALARELEAARRDCTSAGKATDVYRQREQSRAIECDNLRKDIAALRSAASVTPDSVSRPDDAGIAGEPAAQSPANICWTCGKRLPLDDAARAAEEPPK